MRVPRRVGRHLRALSRDGVVGAVAAMKPETVKGCLDNLVHVTQDATIDACVEALENYRDARYPELRTPKAVLNEAIELLLHMKLRLIEGRACSHGGAGGGDDDTPQCEASYPGIPGTCIFTAGPHHPDHHQAPDGWRWSR